MSGPSGVDGGRLWSGCGPWPCVVRHVRRSVLLQYRLRLLSLVVVVLGADPGVSGGALV